MSGFDLARLVEAAGPLARLSLETDAEGEPRVVRLEPLPREVERFVEAACAAPPPKVDHRVLLLEAAAHQACIALGEANRTRTKIEAAVELDAITPERAAELRLELENAMAMAWEQFRMDATAVLGAPK